MLPLVASIIVEPGFKIPRLSASSTIAFAILLFTLLFGIGNGLKHFFEREFAGDATNSVFIYSGNTTKPYKGLQSGRKVQFRNDDTKFINEKFDEVSDKWIGFWRNSVWVSSAYLWAVWLSHDVANIAVFSHFNPQ